jgi:hypothetical protein
MKTGRKKLGKIAFEFPVELTLRYLENWKNGEWNA